MKKNVKFLALMLFSVLLFSCKENTEKKTDTVENKVEEVKETMLATVQSADDQKALSPDDVINIFKEGNERYVNNNLTKRDLPAQVKSSTSGQFPEAIVLSCVDSRVPVEYVFDRGIGDIFVARVAGNFVNEDILGSMEFACKVSGSKLILVMGHEHCGAVKAAVDDVKLGNITPMLTKIKPAVDMHADYDGEKNAKNGEFVKMVCESNVKNTIEEIRKQSPILKEMEEKGEIKIVGGVYDLDTGKVAFLN